MSLIFILESVGSGTLLQLSEENSYGNTKLIFISFDFDFDWIIIGLRLF